MNEFGVEAMRAAVEAIEAFPETFDMGWWSKKKKVDSCGTTLCLLGHMLAYDGWAANYEVQNVEFYGGFGTSTFTKNNETISVNKLARKLFDIATYDWIFHRNRWVLYDVTNVRDAAEKFIAENGPCQNVKDEEILIPALTPTPTIESVEVA